MGNLWTTFGKPMGYLGIPWENLWKTSENLYVLRLLTQRMHLPRVFQLWKIPPWPVDRIQRSDNYTNVTVSASDNVLRMLYAAVNKIGKQARLYVMIGEYITSKHTNQRDFIKNSQGTVRFFVTRLEFCRKRVRYFFIPEALVRVSIYLC